MRLGRGQRRRLRRAGARRPRRRMPAPRPPRPAPRRGASAPARPASAAPVPCPSASGSAAASAPATTAATVAGIPPINPRGPRGPGRIEAVDAAGNTFSFAQTQAEAADSTNCTVTVPDRPLSAKGLATPWELGDGCTWANGGHRGRVHRRHDPGAERPAPGLQPAGDQPGHHPGRGADAADDRAGFAGHPQRRVQRQRAGPGRPGRAAGPLRRRASGTRWSTRRRSATRSTSTGWPTPRSRAAPLKIPATRHRPGRPGLPDHA